MCLVDAPKQSRVSLNPLCMYSSNVVSVRFLVAKKNVFSSAVFFVHNCNAVVSKQELMVVFTVEGLGDFSVMYYLRNVGGTSKL